MDTIILAAYLYQVLSHADSANKAQNQHYQKLSAIKFIIEQHQWFSDEDLEDGGRDSHFLSANPMLSRDTGGGMMNEEYLGQVDMKHWIMTRKAVSLLDALRSHLIDRDADLRVLGIKVDKRMIVQLFVFFFVCTMSQVVEVMSGYVIFGG